MTVDGPRDWVDEHTRIDPDQLAELRRQLSQRADAAGDLDVAYRMLSTPVGMLLVAATEVGVVRVAYECEGFDSVLAALAAQVSARMLRGAARLDAPIRQLEEYFAGRRQHFDLPLDHRLSGGFRQQVQRALPRISYGERMSYKQVAELVGNPQAVRAVGTACATNPLPVVIPCHRVVRSDGTLGGYLGTASAKRVLLDLEAGA